jgi:hypothetical protein
LLSRFGRASVKPLPSDDDYLVIFRAGKTNVLLSSHINRRDRVAK